MTVTNDPSILIGRGEIGVNTLDLVLDTEHTKAWHLNLGSKYAEVLGYGQSAREATVFLHATKDTLYVEEPHDVCTSIHIPVSLEWIVMAECARYTCRIVAYRPTYGKESNHDGS